MQAVALQQRTFPSAAWSEGGGRRVTAARRAHIRRYREIVRVLVRHGLGVLVAEFAPGRLPPFAPRLFGIMDRSFAPAHVRMALEELGTTFIKAGQILSTRADLLPSSYTHEFERLQDRVSPVDSSAVRAVLQEEWGQSPDAIFASFDNVPLASASIGQVHRAVLADGRSVVVKVQKPGVAEQVEVDLAILRQLAQIVAARGFSKGVLDVVGLVDEFAHTLRGELDYEQEARNAAAMSRNFAGDPHLRVPQIYGAYTTRRVLVMEEMSGIRIDDSAGLRAEGIDARSLARRSARILLRSIFEHGLYHADPHPGNFLVGRDGALTALDFGMVGRLDAHTRDALVRVVFAVVQREPMAVIDALEALGVRFRSADQRPAIREVAHLMDAFADMPLGDIELAPLIGEVFGFAARFELQLPADFALLLKTLAMNEGVGRQLDPGFVATEQAARYLRDFALRRITSPRWFMQSLHVLTEAAGTTARLPHRIERAISALEAGEVRLDATSSYWDRLHREVAAASNRIAMAILSAGLAISAALLLPRSIPWGLSIAAAAGGGGLLLAVVVLVSTIRRR